MNRGVRRLGLAAEQLATEPTDGAVPALTQEEIDQQVSPSELDGYNACEAGTMPRQRYSMEILEKFGSMKAFITSLREGASGLITNQIQ